MVETSIESLDQILQKDSDYSIQQRFKKSWSITVASIPSQATIGKNFSIKGSPNTSKIPQNVNCFIKEG